MKKTFLSLAVAAFFAFALVSCGPQATDADLQDDTEIVEPEIDDIEPEIDEPETEVEAPVE